MARPAWPSAGRPVGMPRPVLSPTSQAHRMFYPATLRLSAGVPQLGAHLGVRCVLPILNNFVLYN
jgi:hypothetical protein